MTDIDAVLAGLFPIPSTYFALELVATGEGSIGALEVTLRVAPVEDDDGSLAYTQEVDLVYPMHRDDPRVPAYMAGWASALRTLFARRDELAMVGASPEAHGSCPDPSELVHPDVMYADHLVTPADFERALLFGRWRLGRLLPDSLDVFAAFTAHLPVEAGGFILEFVPETVVEDTGEVLGGFSQTIGDSLVASLRLTVPSADDGTPATVREGPVCLARGEHAHDPRLPEYFAGWALAVRTLFERHAALGADDPRRSALASVEPYALVDHDVLALKRPQTAEAFAAALLADKRLGRLLP